MKHLITPLALGLVITVFMAACADKEPEYITEPCTIDNVGAPIWACGSSKIEGSFTAVGSAPLSQLGQGVSRREAMNNARSNLLKRIQTDIRKKVNVFIESKAHNKTDNISAQISEDIAKMTSADSKQMRYWQSSATKEIYVLVGVAQNDINIAIKETLQSHYNNSEALKKLDEVFPTY